MKCERAYIITALFPAMGMFLVAGLSFTNLFGAIESLGFFVLSLLIVFPALFFSQGLACWFGKGNMWVSLVVSLAAFGVILVRFMNSSALIYVLIYIAAALIGYGAPRLVYAGKQNSEH